MTKTEDTLQKAYGGIPKDVGFNINVLDFFPYRPVKYFWVKWIVRKFFR
jgi:hypothetical protein